MKQESRHHWGPNAGEIEPERLPGKIGHEDAEIPYDRRDTHEKKGDIDCSPGGANQNENDEGGVDHHGSKREVNIDCLKCLFHSIKIDSHQLSRGRFLLIITSSELSSMKDRKTGFRE